MFGNMFGKLQEMKQKVEETKERLKTITVEASSPDGKVKVVATGNQKIQDIQTDEAIWQDPNQAKQLILSTANDALAQAEKIFEAEMKGAAKGVLPNIPGLF